MNREREGPVGDLAAAAKSRRSFLFALRPYFRQVAGLLVVGSLAGIVMNVAIVLPAVFLGQAVNAVLDYERHKAGAEAVGTAAALFVAATAATQLPRIGKRYWLGLARNRLWQARRPSGPRAPARLSFEGVSFSYPGGRPGLSQIDLEVPAGSFVAVTGPVGSGKSTMARLAAGISPPDTGRVLIDGEPVALLSPGERASRVGYLGQEPHLFSGSLVDNVSLSAEPSGAGEADPAVLRALGLAALEHDVAALAEGLATEIGELGTRVSGGQRQRIALARALAAGGQAPALLVLDDPFSAVDVHTEAAVASALRSALGDGAPAGERTTVLLFSHRLAAFHYADRVVVLDAGRVEEEGTHAEVLAAGGLYARIYHAQARLSMAGSVVPRTGRR